MFSIHTNEKETASLCPTSEDIMAAGISSVANGLSHLGSVLAEWKTKGVQTLQKKRSDHWDIWDKSNDHKLYMNNIEVMYHIFQTVATNTG